MPTICQALRCAEATNNPRLLKMVFYFLKCYFIRHGCQGELRLEDGEIIYARSEGAVVRIDKAPTWCMTTAAMDVERKLEATGCYSLRPELRKCYVLRLKSSFGMPDRYAMFEEGSDEFLLSSHKMHEDNHTLNQTLTRTRTRT